MATARVRSFCIEMAIRKVSKLELIWSQEILINGIPWKVKVSEKGTAEEPSLATHLFCANKDQSPNWSLSGMASFNLLSVNGDASSVDYQMEPYAFDASGVGYGTNTLIKWKDLFNQDKKYVKDDTISLEIKVNAENPNDPNRSRLNFECLQKCCDNSTYAAFQLKVTNVWKLMAVRSPQFTLRGLPWQIQLCKTRSSHLGAMLKLKEDPGNEPTNMTMAIKMVSSKKSVRSIEKCITKQYEYLNIEHTQIVSWDEMIKPENGFVNNDSITLECEIYSEKPKGDVKSSLKTGAKSPQMECAICLECIDSQDLSVTPCGHLFCLECIEKVINDRGVCPTCTKGVQLDALRRLYLPAVN